jgi:3-hydroxybutyryl-CoA dehydratase
MDREYFEDYRLGEKFISPARTITEADIMLFAAVSGDWHPIHTDSEYAKKTVFGQRIAHGLLGLVIGSGLAFRLGPRGPLPKHFIAFYGMDNLRFTTPLRIGDTVHIDIEVIDLILKGNHQGIVQFKTELKNQRNEVVNAHESKILVACRPKDGNDPTIEQG